MIIMKKRMVIKQQGTRTEAQNKQSMMYYFWTRKGGCGRSCKWKYQESEGSGSEKKMLHILENIFFCADFSLPVYYANYEPKEQQKQDGNATENYISCT